MGRGPVRSHLEAFRICQKRVPRNEARAFFFPGPLISFVDAGAVWDEAQCVHIWRRLGFVENVLHEMRRGRYFFPGPLTFFVVPVAVWDAAWCVHIWRRLGFFTNVFHEMRRAPFFVQFLKLLLF